MATSKVSFRYIPGVKYTNGQSPFANVRLTGSWDANGRYSDQWSTVPMVEIVNGDGFRSYEATVEFNSSEIGKRFHWGIRLDGPGGANIWGVPTEIQDANSMEQSRSFALDADGQEVVYYMTHCRRLGANKCYRNRPTAPGIQFGVWAPNAKAVEVVIAKLWDRKDPTCAPAVTSQPHQDICGGYISDNGEGAHPQLGPFKMTRQPDGVWVTDPNEPALADFTDFDHKPYMYRIVKKDGSVAYRTDIYSRCQIGFGKDNPWGQPYRGLIANLHGSVGCSVVVDPEKVTQYFREEPPYLTEPLCDHVPPYAVFPERHFISEKEFWKNELDASRPLPTRVEDLVIYQLHTGALGFGSLRPGTIEDAISFLDYLVDLGINAVELLPMSEFGAGGESWGYSTSHYFAIEYAGGGRDQYKMFVKECHRRGIAVIIDVVYNHFIHQAERAEWMYDSNAHEENIYYWYEGKPSDYAHPDGGYMDNMSTAFAPRYWEEMVRKLFISSAVALMQEFHVDGFRVDQTTSIHSYNGRHADGKEGGQANVFGAKLLREWSRTLRMINPGVILTAEDHSTWDAVLKPTDQGGLGFDARWYADFYHHLVGDAADRGPSYARLIKVAGYGGNDPLAIDYFAGALSASNHGCIVYNESHDEAGNAGGTKRTLVVAVNEASMTPETRRFAEARCRFALGMSMFSAGTPMFLFGEEIGAQKDFKYDFILTSKEDLIGERSGAGRALFDFYSAAIRFRLQWPALRSRNIYVIYTHNANRVIAFRRWDAQDQFLVLASLNNQPFDAGYFIPSDRIGTGQWREVFNSDDAAFGGSGVGNKGGILTSGSAGFSAVIPSNGFVIFRKVG